MEHNILQALQSPCLVFDRDGKVLFKNKRLLEISPLRCKGSEDMEKGLQRGFEEVLFETFMMLSERARGSDFRPEGMTISFIALDKTGKELTFEAEFSVVERDRERIIICLLRDISHYKKMEMELENKEEFLWLLMFNLPIGLIFVRPDTGLIEDLNLEAATLIGIDREHALNKRCSEFFASEEKECCLIGSLNGTRRQECLLLRTDGNKIPVLLTSKLLSVSDSEVVMLAFLDLSERKRLEEQLKNLSITDALTGIYNRRFFVERLTQEIERAKRYGEPFCVIMLDLDHFKSINDNFGHNKGDEVLIGTANTIKARIRASDVLARWGGEEFVILLPSTDLKGAIVLANDIRERLRQQDFSIGRKVTCSFGVYEYSLGDNVDTMMTKVDSLLYQAKAAGRDCIKCHLP